MVPRDPSTRSRRLQGCAVPGKIKLRACRRRPIDVWEKRHREFHFALYATCGSPWLLRFCELLIQNGERYRRAFVRYTEIDRSITEEHEALLDAAIKKDALRAVKILEKHIRHAAELAAKNLFKTNKPSTAGRRKQTAR
jgi:GntR family transcriptional regulator, carbon starvation induced regulator